MSDTWNASDLADAFATGGEDGPDLDGSVIVSKRDLYNLQKAAGAKPPVKTILEELHAAKDTNEIMAILDKAGVATAWNRQ